ncbi:MAG: hypothetical protein EZS28_043493, partial [Streblomastix strix]
MVVSSL